MIRWMLIPITLVLFAGELFATPVKVFESNVSGGSIGFRALFPGQLGVLISLPGEIGSTVVFDQILSSVDPNDISGQSFTITEATDPDFNAFVNTWLAGGNMSVQMLWPDIWITSGQGITRELLGGTVTSLELRINQFEYTTPSYDPNDDGIWTEITSLNINLWADGELVLGPEIPTPEPGTILLLGTGLVGLIGYSRRKRNI